MSFEREQGRAYARSSAEAADELDEIAPGRVNRTGRLASPSHPVVSELIRRRMRDGRELGGAPGRVIAIASTTSGTSGHRLAHSILRKAEAGAPGRRTWSSTLPAAVMRSAEHSEIDPAVEREADTFADAFVDGVEAPAGRPPLRTIEGNLEGQDIRW